MDGWVTIDGRRMLNFCANNYLGLANDSRLGQAIVDCLQTEGYGAGAARLVCGNMPSHNRLEAATAKFKRQERCLLFSSGYMANVGIISSLFGKGDVLFSDRLNHASIIDGIRLSGATMLRYRHKDMEHLEELLERTVTLKKKCIITDSVFSMDGDLAPLDKIVELAEKHDALVAVSFPPYTPMTVELTERAAERGVPVIALTDSAFSPLSPKKRHGVLLRNSRVKNYFLITTNITPRVINFSC